MAGISTGFDHSIYWTTNGGVYVFEGNQNGQLGFDGRMLSTKEKQVLLRSESVRPNLSFFSTVPVHCPFD